MITPQPAAGAPSDPADAAAAAHDFGARTLRVRTYVRKNTVSRLLGGLALLAIGIGLLVYGLAERGRESFVLGGWGLFVLGLGLTVQNIVRARRGNRWLSIYQRGLIDHQEGKEPVTYDLRVFGVSAHHVRGLYTIQVVAPGGKATSLPVGEEGNQVMDLLTRTSVEAQLVPFLERLDRGETVQLGDIKLNREGIEDRTGGYLWAELEKVRMDGSTAVIEFSNFGAVLAPLALTPDAPLFVTLVERLTGRVFVR